MDLTGQPPPDPPRAVRNDALARADTAWRVRVAGGTWAEAARVAGFTDEHNAARAVRSAYGQLPGQQRDDLRDLWRARLETLWRQVLRDASEQRAGAITAAVRVATAAVALDGLAEPVSLDVNVSTLAALDQEMRAFGL